MNTQPTITDETIQRMEDMSWFTHTQIFDDLLIVAQKETACYVWKTGAGLVVFDGIWPDERVVEEIRAAIKKEKTIGEVMLTTDRFFNQFF